MRTAGNRRLPLALFVVALAASCGAAQSRPASAERLVAPVNGAALAQVRQKLTEAVEYEMALQDVGALSVALIANGEVVWAKGFRHNDAKGTVPARADTVYRVGSFSALLTGIAIIQLAEEGQLDLDAPVKSVLPDFNPRNPYATPITVRHLLTHRSGLAREPPVGSYFDKSQPSLHDTVASLNRTSLVFEPGTAVKYSNATISVLGAIIEKLTHHPFDEVIRARILDPLAMDSSAFSLEKDLSSRLARGVVTSYDDPRRDAASHDPGEGPAGDLYSTVEDLARFLIALHRGAGNSAGRQFISPTVLQKMWPPKGAGSAPGSFGLGFQLEEFAGARVLGHSGRAPGFVANAKVTADAGAGVVMAANLDQFPISRLSRYAIHLLLAARAGQSLPDYPKSEPLSAETIRNLKGYYRSTDELIVLRKHGATQQEQRLFVEGGPEIGELRRLGADWVLERGDTLLKVAINAKADRIRLGNQLFEHVEPDKPAPPAADFANLIGHYGWPYDYIRVYEWNGRPHVRIEWRHHYQMTPVSKDVYAFPEEGLYAYEKLEFRRDKSGKGVSVSLNGIVFPRRDFGAEFKAHLQKMMRPSETLKAEALAAKPPVEKGDFRPADLVELASIDPTIKARLAYATPDNLFGFPTYDESKAVMQRPAAEALGRVSAALRPLGYGLMIHDAYRPWYVTKIFWDATPEAGKNYVAKPWEGSRHNRGAAVDLTLYELATGEPVEMAAGLDEVSMRSYFAFVGGTDLQRWHRDLLRREMEKQGFTVYPEEWWHFDFKDWRKYRIQNKRFEDLN